MNDLLIFGGAICVIAGFYLIMPALALVVTGGMLIVAGLARMRGNRGAH